MGNHLYPWRSQSQSKSGGSFGAWGDGSCYGPRRKSSRWTRVVGGVWVIGCELIFGGMWIWLSCSWGAWDGRSEGVMNKLGLLCFEQEELLKATFNLTY